MPVNSPVFTGIALDDLPVNLDDFSPLPAMQADWRDEFMGNGKYKGRYWQWRKRGKLGKKEKARYGGKSENLSAERREAYQKRAAKIAATKQSG